MGHALRVGHRGYALAPHMVEHGGLEAAEREVGPSVAHLGHRELHRAVVGAPRQAVHEGPSGIPEAQELGHLVEGLARRVVAGAAQQAVVAAGRNFVEARVAPGHHQGEGGEGKLSVGQERGLQVAGDMVDGHERLALRIGQALGDLHPHEERAHEPGALGDRDRVEVGQLQLRFGEGLPDDGNDVLDVMARGQLGHHPAVGGVEGGLGRDHARQHAPAVFHHRGRRLVARRFDGEQAHFRQLIIRSRTLPPRRTHDRSRPGPAAQLARAGPGVDRRLRSLVWRPSSAAWLRPPAVLWV